MKSTHDPHDPMTHGWVDGIAMYTPWWPQGDVAELVPSAVGLAATANCGQIWQSFTLGGLLILFA